MLEHFLNQYFRQDSEFSACHGLILILKKFDISMFLKVNCVLPP